MHRKSGLALAAVIGCLLASASSASAVTIHCHGNAASLGSDPTELTYGFTCGEPMRGFSIVSNLEVGEFSTTADVYEPNFGPADAQSFTCEGDIPSRGFGCFGFAWDHKLITGTLAIDVPRCVKGKNQLLLWLVAVDANNKPSGPFRLKVPYRCSATGAKHTRPKV